MGRIPLDFVKNDGGHNDSVSAFLLPRNFSPKCYGCHVDRNGKITKRLGMSRVVTDGSSAGYNIYRQQGGRGLFFFRRQSGDEYNILLKQEGATAADGAVTHCHLYQYATGSTVTQLAGITTLPPVRTNPRGIHVGPDLFMGWPVVLGSGTGTVATNGTTTVTFSGSYATTAYGAVAGYLILIEGEPDWIEIAAVAPGSDATKLTLSSAATTSASGKTYCIAPRGGIKLEGGDANLTPRWIGVKVPGTAASAVEADSGGSITSAVDGTYRFRYTYMNDAGHESNMSPVPAAGVAVTGTGSTKVTVTLTAISPSDAQVVKYRLYADKDESGVYAFVKEAAWSTSAVVTTDSELTLTGVRPGPTDNDAPLFCCSYYTMWNRRLVGIGDPAHPNRVYFTEQGEENWEGFPINLRTSQHWYIELVNAPTLTMVDNQDGRLLVFGEREIYTLGGHRYVTDDYNAPTASDMSPIRLCSETGVGCLAPDSLVDVNGERWFWTHLGLYRMGYACPHLVTPALDAITKRVNQTYAYLASATFDFDNREYILSLPLDDNTTNSHTIRVNVDSLAVMVDDVGMQCVRRVKEDEVHVLSNTGVIQKWATADAHKDGPYSLVSSVSAGCTTTSIKAAAAFTAYTSSWGTLSGVPIMMLTGQSAGEVCEILDVDDANTATTRTAFSVAPSQGDLFAIGAINCEYQFPWIRNEKAEPNRASRMHMVRLWLDSEATGEHTEVGYRSSASPSGDPTWNTRYVDTRNTVEKVAACGIWGRYFQARVRSVWPDEHLVVSGVSIEVSQ